jgi:hypothetical protein
MTFRERMENGSWPVELREEDSRPASRARLHAHSSTRRSSGPRHRAILAVFFAPTPGLADLRTPPFACRGDRTTGTVSTRNAPSNRGRGRGASNERRPGFFRGGRFTRRVRARGSRRPYYTHGERRRYADPAHDWQLCGARWWRSARLCAGPTLARPGGDGNRSGARVTGPSERAQFVGGWRRGRPVYTDRAEFTIRGSHRGIWTVTVNPLASRFGDEARPV